MSGEHDHTDEEEALGEAVLFLKAWDPQGVDLINRYTEIIYSRFTQSLERFDALKEIEAEYLKRQTKEGTETSIVLSDVWDRSGKELKQVRESIGSKEREGSFFML